MTGNCRSTKSCDSGPSAAKTTERGLARSQRLTRAKDFSDAYSQRLKQVGRFMVMWQRKADDACLRLGVVASKKVGNAPERARAKRLLREAFRVNRSRLDTADDIVIVARRAILAVNCDKVETELLRLLEKAKLLK